MGLCTSCYQDKQVGPAPSSPVVLGSSSAMGGSLAEEEFLGDDEMMLPSSPRRKRRRKMHAQGVDIGAYYELHEVLGKGGFGEVRRATSKEDGTICAVKIVSKLRKVATKQSLEIFNEVDLMSRVRGHRNVVNLLETFEDKGNYYIVMELCCGGELLDRIMEMHPFTEKQASYYFRQMAEGIRHCHANKVVHRDIKPENFLFTSREVEAPLKLTDFGLSIAVRHLRQTLREPVGSAYYIAPEVFSKRYHASADIWSLGIVLHLMLSGNVPFGGSAKTEKEVYDAIQEQPVQLKGSQWRHVGDSAKRLVLQILEKDPSKRPTIDQIVEHPWVRGETARDSPLDASVLQSLCNFNAHNKLKKEALRLVASTFTPEDVHNLRAMFRRIDTDDTGTISFQELSEALRRMGVAEADVRATMQQLDTDGDGEISYEEFLVATTERQMIHHQNAMWWAFCEYDRDNDGYISAPELRQALQSEKPEDVERWIAEFDLDGDGKINYEEFMKMLLPKHLKYRISRYH